MAGDRQREGELAVIDAHVAADSWGTAAALVARLAVSGALVAYLSAAGSRPAGAQEQPLPVPRPRAQNPSPMVEHTRAHERLPADAPPGRRFSVETGLARAVDVFLPEGVSPLERLRLLVHFHGAGPVVMHAAARSKMPTLAVVVHLGAGSSVYEQPFRDSETWDRLLGAVRAAFTQQFGATPTIARIDVSAFSAGYGAVRALARVERPRARFDGVLLLDGLHADYLPDGRVLAEGGALDAEDLAPFVGLARRAVTSELTLVVTHSEIFPGTFASTTETIDHLLAALGLARRPVLTWGPVGMQQLSEAGAGRFRVLGFAGNTAPDHVDHLHGLPTFLDLLSAR